MSIETLLVCGGIVALIIGVVFLTVLVIKAVRMLSKYEKIQKQIGSKSGENEKDKSKIPKD